MTVCVHPSNLQIVSHGEAASVAALPPDTPVVVVMADGETKRATAEVALVGARNGHLAPEIVGVHREV